MLKISNLSISAKENKQNLLSGINLNLDAGQIYGLVGKNGSGKTTLASAIMGSQELEIVQGKIEFEEQDITEVHSDIRANHGIFVSFQHPVEISGVSTFSYLREVKNALLNSNNQPPMAVSEVLKKVKDLQQKLGLPADYLERGINEGLSGGEKKRSEILQMLFFEPKLIILDEIDSGLDSVGLQVVCELVQDFLTPNKTLLIISHQKQIFEYLQPTVVFEMEGLIHNSC